MRLAPTGSFRPARHQESRGSASWQEPAADFFDPIDMSRRQRRFSTTPPLSPLLSPTRQQYIFAQLPTRTMAVGATTGRHAADEEARAEVDVLNSRLEKTTQLTKKIQASLGRLEATGKSVRDVSGPLNGETKRLQTLSHSESSPAYCTNAPFARC